MRRALAAAVLLAALAGCGSEPQRTVATACEGLPTASDGAEEILSGALDRLDRRQLCRRLGRPDVLTPRGDREAWTYDGMTWVLDPDGRLVAFEPAR